MLDRVSPPCSDTQALYALSGMAAGSLVLPGAARAAFKPDISLEIAPYMLEASPKHHIQTVAYNGQVPGPLLRMLEGQPRSVEIRN